MGLLGSQAGNEKNAGCELWATFEGYFFMFSWAKIKSFENCRVRTKKLLDKKVKLKKNKIGKYFGGVKNSCFGFRVKGVCLLLLPLVSLVRPYAYLDNMQKTLVRKIKVN